MSIDTKSHHRTNVGGGVFRDLGFPPKEAKRLLAHADAQIDESIRVKQHLMDEVLDVARPRVSDVVNHKVEKFTVDTLVSALGRIGKQVLGGAIAIAQKPLGPVPRRLGRRGL